MILRIQTHEFRIRDRGCNTASLVKGHRIVATAVQDKSWRGYFRQQINNVDSIGGVAIPDRVFSRRRFAQRVCVPSELLGGSAGQPDRTEYSQQGGVVIAPSLLHDGNPRFCQFGLSCRTSPIAAERKSAVQNQLRHLVGVASGMSDSGWHALRDGENRVTT